MNYFDSLIYKTTTYRIREKFPKVMIFRKDDPYGNSYLCININPKFPEKRKEYGFSKSFREFLIQNGRLLFGCRPVNPFTWDALSDLIYNTEKEMTISKIEKYNVNTRNTIKRAQTLIAEGKLILGNRTEDSFDILLQIDEQNRSYRFLSDNDPNTHLIKLDPETELVNEKEYAINSLPPLLKFKVIRTLCPGLKIETAKLIAGFETDINDPEDPYGKEYLNFLYKKLNIKPLDIVFDVFDCIQIGDYANDPMRHLRLTDGREFGYRKKLDALGKPDIEIIKFEDYLERRNEIIDDYKNILMTVYAETGAGPAEALKYINEKKTVDGPVIFKDTNKTIVEIKKDHLAEPLRDLSSSMQNSMDNIPLYEHYSINCFTTAHTQTFNVIIKSFDHTAKIMIDIKTLSINKTEYFYKKRPIEHIPADMQVLVDKVFQLLGGANKYPGYRKYKLEQNEHIEFVKELITTDAIIEVYKVKEQPIELYIDFFENSVKVRSSLGQENILEILKEYQIDTLIS